MVSMVERYAAALLGFGLVAVALTAGLTTALLAGAGAGAAYGLVALRQRRRLDRLTEQFMEASGDGDGRGERHRARGRSRRAAWGWRTVRHVFFDLPNGQVSLDADQVAQLRDAAAAQAGRSTAARDLSLLLARALEQVKPVALRRAEVQTLIQIATDAHLDEIVAKLAALDGNAAA
jgi:hypothetical protein